MPRQRLGPWGKWYASTEEDTAHYTDRQFRVWAGVFGRAVANRGELPKLRPLRALYGADEVDFLVSEGRLAVSRTGVVTIPGWRTYQAPVDPKNRERQARWRASRQAPDDPVTERNGEVTPLRNARNAVSVTVSPTSTSTSTSTEKPKENGTADLPRARASARPPAREDWPTFGPEWGPTIDAWRDRFQKPPSGGPKDDPEAPHPSQRAILWSILDTCPGQLPGWIASAPPGANSYAVLRHVVERFHGYRSRTRTS